MTYEEVVARRLSATSSALVVLALVAFSGLLYQIDAQDAYRDVEALTTLERISSPSFPRSNDLFANEQAQVLGPRLRDWLAHQYPNLDHKQKQSREKVIDWLKMDPNAIAGLEGKTVATDATPFRLYELKLEQPLPAPGQQAETVSSLIDKLTALSKPTSVSIVTSLSVPEASVLTEDGIRWSVNSVLLSDHTVSVALKDASHQPSWQSPPAEKTIPFDVETETISGPAYLELYPFAEAERLALADLAASTARLDDLGRRYGLFDVHQARGLAQQALAESYKSISVLGFNFAPRHLPVVILILSSAILAFALYTIEQVRLRGTKLTETDNNSLLYAFMQNCWGRYLVWACLPPISVLIALPVALVTRWQLIAFSALAFLLAGLGIICCWRAAGIFRETE